MAGYMIIKTAGCLFVSKETMNAGGILFFTNVTQQITGNPVNPSEVNKIFFSLIPLLTSDPPFDFHTNSNIYIYD